MLAPDAPDVLKGQAVVVAFSDMYTQAAYQGGVWRKSLLEGWLMGTGMADVNLETFREHPHYDEFWADMNPEAQAHRVNAPGVFVGGWYDIFLQGTINSFVTIHNHGGPNARGRCRLIIAPIGHGPFNELKYLRTDRGFVEHVTRIQHRSPHPHSDFVIQRAAVRAQPKHGRQGPALRRDKQAVRIRRTRFAHPAADLSGHGGGEKLKIVTC